MFINGYEKLDMIYFFEIIEELEPYLKEFNNTKILFDNSL